MECNKLALVVAAPHNLGHEEVLAEALVSCSFVVAVAEAQVEVNSVVGHQDLTWTWR